MFCSQTCLGKSQTAQTFQIFDALGTTGRNSRRQFYRFLTLLMNMIPTFFLHILFVHVRDHCKQEKHFKVWVSLKPHKLSKFLMLWVPLAAILAGNFIDF